MSYIVNVADKRFENELDKLDYLLEKTQEEVELKFKSVHYLQTRFDRFGSFYFDVVGDDEIESFKILFDGTSYDNKVERVVKCDLPDAEAEQSRFRDITNDFAMFIVNNYQKDWSELLLGKYYVPAADRTTSYIGIDNSDGECYVEEFAVKEVLDYWLSGEIEYYSETDYFKFMKLPSSEIKEEALEIQRKFSSKQEIDWQDKDMLGAMKENDIYDYLKFIQLEKVYHKKFGEEVAKRMAVNENVSKSNPTHFVGCESIGNRDYYDFEEHTFLSTKDITVVVDFDTNKIKGSQVAYGEWTNLDYEEVIPYLDKLDEKDVIRDFTPLKKSENKKLTKRIKNIEAER